LAEKKVRDQPIEDRKQWICRDDALALARQCDLAGVARSAVYISDVVTLPSELELILLAEIDAEYTRHPFFGSRKMKIHLENLGHAVNRKWIQRLWMVLC
jgi:putative transposase